MREIETKLVCMGAEGEAAADDLSVRARIGDIVLGEARVAAIHDVYCDTPDGDLAAWGGALRVRSVDGAVLLTLKGPANEGAGRAFADRLELEAPCTPANLTRVLDEVHRAGALVEITQTGHGEGVELLTDAGFTPILDKHTHRVTRRIGDRRATLAIDRARFSVGDRTVTLTEIEIEAHDPAHAELLDELAAAIVRCYPGALRTWRCTKLGVGLALHRLDARVVTGFACPLCRKDVDEIEAACQ